MTKKSILLSIILVLFSGSRAVPGSAPQIQKSLSQQVDELFSEWDRNHSPGCALAVVKNGKIVYEHGYGMADLEHDVPITPQTVFYIGSVSKQFVAFCILLLEEEGKLSLDDDIRIYLPDFPRYQRPITIRHLIHHTSGIRDYLALWSLTGRSYLDEMPEQAVYDLIRRQKALNFPPGERHLYSNSCYFLLAKIVAVASSKSLKDFARENIFQPLGMRHTHFHDNNSHIIPNRAYGYTREENGDFANLITRFDLVGSGGLYTNVEDLYLWDQNFYHNRLGKGRQELVKKMLTNGRLNNGEEVNYAFALVNGEYRGLRTVQHGGALGGYRAFFLRFPEQRFSVILLSNFARLNPAALAYRVADIYLADYFTTEKAVPPPVHPPVTQKPRPIRLSQAQLQEYVGVYYSDELQVSYKLTDVGQQLQLNIGYQPAILLRPGGKDIWSGRITLTFTRNSDGTITGFSLDAGRVENLLFEKQ